MALRPIISLSSILPKCLHHFVCFLPTASLKFLSYVTFIKKDIQSEIKICWEQSPRILPKVKTV